MAVEMIMPKVDMDQETGTVVEWRKNDGDSVEQGEIILVIETDKVAIDVESPGTGVLAGINIGEGDTVPIGTVIAYILAPGEELPEPAAAVAETTETPGLPDSPDKGFATPVAANMAAAYGMDVYKLSGSGKEGKVTKRDVEEAVASADAPAKHGKIVASPAARRIARERGVDLAQVAGTGPLGRIQGFDVEAFTPLKTAPGFFPVSADLDSQIIPLKGMRKKIAERLTASYQTIPHIKFTECVDMTRFNDQRGVWNKQVEKYGGRKISATAIFLKIVANTLKTHPRINSSITSDSILLHKKINIGIAVALDDGLIVPVVKDADQKKISELASEVSDLAGRAREGKLLSSDVKGGTFTISNLGPFGVHSFDAIINPPEAAILAISGPHDEALALDDGRIEVRPVMNFTLSADHRIIDGAVAAKFAVDLKHAFENPELE